MINGTTVRTRYGKKLYKAERSPGAYYRFDLFPVDGGRIRYRVHLDDLCPDSVTSQGRLTVQTSVGPVQVPRTWSIRYPSFTGSSRRSHLGKKWVFKIPTGYWGQDQNALEAAMWALQSKGSRKGIPRKAIVEAAKKRSRGVRVAECYLLPCGSLMMERVRPLYNLINENDKIRKGEPGYVAREDLPKWVSVVDSNQVGYNRHGELVAYDV